MVHLVDYWVSHIQICKWKKLDFQMCPNDSIMQTINAAAMVTTCRLCWWWNKWNRIWQGGLQLDNSFSHKEQQGNALCLWMTWATTCKCRHACVIVCHTIPLTCPLSPLFSRSWWLVHCRTSKVFSREKGMEFVSAAVCSWQ